MAFPPSSHTHTTPPPPHPPFLSPFPTVTHATNPTMGAHGVCAALTHLVASRKGLLGQGLGGTGRTRRSLGAHQALPGDKVARSQYCAVPPQHSPLGGPSIMLKEMCLVLWRGIPLSTTCPAPSIATHCVRRGQHWRCRGYRHRQCLEVPRQS